MTGGRRCALPWLAWLAMATLMPSHALCNDMPQEVGEAVETVLAEAPSDKMPPEADWADDLPAGVFEATEEPVAVEQVEQADYHDDIGGLEDELVDCGDCLTSENWATGQPVSWISGPYLRTGFTVPMGDDFFAHQDTGYAIAVGFRHALASGLAGDRWFVDLGGSYLLANGETTRNTEGLRTNFQGGQSLLDDSFATTLTELQRGSVHEALGRYWGSPLDDCRRDPQIRLSARLGVRAGHVRGKFDELQLRDPPIFGSIVPTHRETDTFGGVFAGTDWILLERQLSFGQMRWNLDAEVSNDWVNLRGFDAGNLVTASVTLGFMFSR